MKTSEQAENESHQAWVGIDVSKKDFHVSVYGDKHVETFQQTDRGFSKLLKRLPTKSLVVVEATGGYEMRLVDALHKAAQLRARLCLLSCPSWASLVPRRLQHWWVSLRIQGTAASTKVSVGSPEEGRGYDASSTCRSSLAFVTTHRSKRCMSASNTGASLPKLPSQLA